MAKGLPYSTSRGMAAQQLVRTVTYPVQNVSLPTTAGAAADGFGTVVIGDFPEGNILFLGGISYLQFSTTDADIIATWSGSYGIGTVPTADNTIATTDEDLIVEATINAATAKVSPVTRGASAASLMAIHDNTDGSLELNLNLRIADASYTDSQSATFTVNGYVKLVYVVLGDD